MIAWLAAGALAGTYMADAEPRPAAATPGQIDAAAAGYDAMTMYGARTFGQHPHFVASCRYGINLLYERRYADVRGYFGELARIYPGAALQHVADVLVWQAMMLENFDLRHDAAYKSASAKGQAELQAALGKPGNDAWEHFMMTGLVGLEAIHAARQGKYLAALPLAFRAIEEVEATRKAAPQLVDLSLADGLYNYWRSALTQDSAVLPDFGDNRAEGVRQIREVEAKGLYLSPPATLSMVFVHMEEDRWEEALASVQKNRELYPKNVINELMGWIVLLKLKRYDDGLAVFDRVLRLDPTNVRSRYYRGSALFRLGRYDEAIAQLTDYLAQPYQDEEQRGYTHWRIGQCQEALGRLDEAEASMRLAAKATGHAEVKASLAAVVEKRAGQAQ